MKKLPYFLLLISIGVALLGAASAPVFRSKPAPLSSDDREFIVSELRRLASDDSGWKWIELYEVNYPNTDPARYLSRANFERLKAARAQALSDAAYILETYQSKPSLAENSIDGVRR